MFVNRQDAGRRLAAELIRFRDARPCVLALPRGGVPVAFEVAVALKAPLDLVLVRKIGAPDNPEYAIGAVADGPQPETVINREAVAALGVSEAYLAEETARQLEEIERRRRVYLANRPRLDIADRTVLLVDDGIATGATVTVAIRATRKSRPRRLVLAVPVASTEAIAALRPEVDEIVCLTIDDYLGAIGAYYRDFRQVGDAEVCDLLARSPP